MTRYLKHKYQNSDSATQSEVILLFYLITGALILFSAISVYDGLHGRFFHRVGIKIVIPLLVFCGIMLLSGRYLIAKYSGLTGVFLAALIGTLFGPLTSNQVMDTPVLIILYLYFGGMRLTIAGVLASLIILSSYFIRRISLGIFRPEYFMDTIVLFTSFTALAIATVRRLKNNVEEKEELLKEVHHRVRNNLQLISSLGRLENTKNNNTDKLTSKILSISSVHNYIYQSRNYNRIDFTVIIERLITSLLRNIPAGNLIFTKPEDSVYINLEKSIPLALICNELFSYIIQRAEINKQKESITVSFTCIDSVYKLIITTSGENNTSEFTPDTRILKNLQTQLDADLKMKLQEKNSITLIFPLKHQS